MLVSQAGGALRPEPRTNLEPKARACSGVTDYFLQGVRDATEWLGRHPAVRGPVAASTELLRHLAVFPKCIYPTLSGTMPAERELILKTLDGLPLQDVSAIHSLSMVPAIPQAAGLTQASPFQTVVTVGRDQASLDPAWFREIVTHETGHAKDHAAGWFRLLGTNGRGLWGHPPFVSDYARTHYWEDYAETYAHYHLRPEQLRAVAPEKFALMQQHETPSLLEAIVDRPDFRATGRWIGDALGAAPGLRLGFQILQWESGALQILRGLDELRVASRREDAREHVDGVLDLLAGALFATWMLAPGAMAVNAAHRALQHSMDHGRLRVQDADLAVRALSDPVECPLRAVGHALRLMPQWSPLDLDDTVPARPWIAVGTEVGGAAGGLAGGVAGPLLGVAEGFAWGGPVGGAVGLVAGSLAGFYVGSIAGGDVGGALMRILGG